MTYEILATPNSIARGRYSIGEKENNLFLKLMYAIQRDNKEYIIAENRKTELSEDDILKWKSLCEIETLTCKLTPEDFNEIFKRKNDKTENSLKETFSALSNCSITFDTVTRDGIRAKMIASLISHFYIEKETGNYQVVVPAKLYKYLFDLGLGHTQNALQVIYRLKGIYAQRFYIILRSWTGAKRDIEFSVKELRDMLQLGDKNKTFNSFETNILKRSIDEFRRQNFDIQNSGKVDDIFAAQEDLNNRYADMRRQDMVNRYLLSEVCLCRMVQDICRTVVETIEFDVDFLNN